MRNFISWLLTAVFLFVYVRIFVFMNISFNSSVGVLFGSIAILVISLVLAIVTTKKIVNELSRK